MWNNYLGKEDESHWEEATKDEGSCNESETCVSLRRDDKTNRGRNQAQNNHIVDWHTNVAWVIYTTSCELLKITFIINNSPREFLLDFNQAHTFHTARFVRQKQTENQKKSFITIDDA